MKIIDNQRLFSMMKIENFEYSLKLMKNDYFKVAKTYILGNTSCDLDSFISSYLLSTSKNYLENQKKKKNEIYIPLINCNRNELKLRFDISFLLKKYQINPNKLSYINDELIIKDLKSNQNSKIILVDHNKLDVNQEYLLKDKIIGIYDHHKDENYSFKNIKKKNIIFPLGSCSSLILNLILKKKNLKNIFNYIHPLLSVSAILIDTQNFDKNFYKKKWIDLDKNVFDEIVYKRFKYSSSQIDQFYNEINYYKCNEKLNLSLSIEELMKKDKKTYIYKNFDKKNKIEVNIGWSCIPIQINTLANKYSYFQILDTIKALCMKHGHNLYSIAYRNKTLNENCFLFYNHNIEDIKMSSLLNHLKLRLGKDCSKNEDFKINNNILHRFYVKTFISRKHFEPLLRQFFIQYK